MLISLNMNLPVLVINFKAYGESTGKRAIEIARYAENVSFELGVEIVVAPSFVDLVKVKENVTIPVFAQHVDSVSPGSYTGKITIENLKDWEIDGVIINHSENQVNISHIDYVIKKAKEMNMKTLVCAINDEISSSIAYLSPDFIAIEPPELIGGNISVSTARPELIKNGVEKIKKINKNVIVLTGAGIKNGTDVKMAIELGSQGVLVASGITKAKDPLSAIKELAWAMR